jgi:hypothetical protein
LSSYETSNVKAKPFKKKGIKYTTKYGSPHHDLYGKTVPEQSIAMAPINKDECMLRGQIELSGHASITLLCWNGCAAKIQNGPFWEVSISKIFDIILHLVKYSLCHL